MRAVRVLLLGLVLAAALFLPSLALGQVKPLPVRVVGERVTVRAEAGLGELAAKFVDTAEDGLARIERNLPGLPRLEQVEVRLVQRPQDLPLVAPAGSGAPTWAQGVAYLREGVISVAWRDRAGNIAGAEKTFVHELAHMALHQATAPHDVPRWLHEGFAYIHSSDVSFPRMWTLGSAVFGQNLIPLRELDMRFPVEENEVHLAYVEAYDFVSFLARRGRWSDAGDDGDPHAFQQLLKRLGAGESLDQAAHAAYGRTLAELENEWIADMRARFLWLPVGVAASALWVVATILLVLGWARRTMQKRKRLRQMEAEERVWEEMA